MARYTAEEKQDAIAKLRTWLKPNDVVACILQHVSRSGMQREISLIIPDRDDARRVHKIDFWVARALDYRIGKHGGLVVGGCGMDMGFHLVYTLARVLFPEGHTDPDGHKRDAGYALRSEWL